MNEIDQYNHKWFSLDTETNNESKYRYKRAIFSTVGDVNKVLFGTLDEHDETDLQTLYERLKEKNKDELSSSRMRTSILKTSIERFTNTSKMSDEQTNNVNKNIKEIKILLKILNYTWKLEPIHHITI